MPRTMGWLWNINDGCLEGWRPGAVARPVARIMKFFAAQRRLEEQQMLKDEPVAAVESPTLQISGKNGEFCIILNPSTSSSSTAANPVVFMLTKSDFARRIARVKEILREKGLKVSCNCEKSFANCECMKREEKQQIEFELAELSKDEGSGDDDLRLSDELTFQLLKSNVEDDSEVDFTFTPARFADVAHRVKSVSYAACQYEYECKDVPVIKAAGSQLKAEEEAVNFVVRAPQQRDEIPLRKKGSKDDSGKM